METSMSDGLSTETKQRLEQWESLIVLGVKWSDRQQLTAVNNFINRLDYVSDNEQWHTVDYWATPLQTIVTKGGDCEDFAIAKYFTLVAMGMDEKKLRLTYAKTINTNTSHIVLTYFEQANADPLVLDNLHPSIMPAYERQDLQPVYSFNAKGIWLEKRENRTQYLARSSRLTIWRELLNKMNVEAADETRMVCLYQYYDLDNPVAKAYCPS